MLGPQNISNGRLSFYQEKGNEKVKIDIPILAPLAESILASETGSFCFVITNKGIAYTRNSMGNMMRKWCDSAGLYHCTAHGLRKSAAVRLALAGCTNQEIKAWTGHKTEAEVSRYTETANKPHLADAGAVKLLANLKKGSPINPHKTLNRKDN